MSNQVSDVGLGAKGGTIFFSKGFYRDSTTHEKRGLPSLKLIQHLKIGGWKMNFLFGVRFGDCIILWIIVSHHRYPDEPTVFRLGCSPDVFRISDFDEGSLPDESGNQPMWFQLFLQKVESWTITSLRVPADVHLMRF